MGDITDFGGIKELSITLLQDSACHKKVGGRHIQRRRRAMGCCSRCLRSEPVLLCCGYTWWDLLETARRIVWVLAVGACSYFMVMQVWQDDDILLMFCKEKLPFCYCCCVSKNLLLLLLSLHFVVVVVAAAAALVAVALLSTTT